ncbi:DUF4338 domain-containing protein [Paenibacillus sp. G2S3]|uniref:Druantia anti-phage system protein DruA n=1 Tax=Paenibacillus sp. G2S3 TaxID=3047872 RepID=UPI0024C1FD11|nr:Druantia anti-phage system protein DruA [Paenibacillus sp. G2S3]WHY20109.1 DUF4338 domain-containing protein [Paenibacillus sp. G2S3]
MASKATKKNKQKSEFLPFNPSLDSYQKEVFIIIVKGALETFVDRRVAFINEKIENLKLITFDNDVEGSKLLSALSILRDLISQGWRMMLEDDIAQLAPPKQLRSESKDYLRQQLRHERDAQFSVLSVKKFILRMEKVKRFNGRDVSILNLIGDSELIAARTREIQTAADETQRDNLAREAVKPYIQLVSNNVCTHTGYKLMDIWRYFRYTWSIPYKSTPGRNLFYIIRDAAQPDHPVMGIAALGNCVLQLTHRDNNIGWTTEAIKLCLKKKVKTERYEELLKGQNGLKRSVEKTTELESEEEYQIRVLLESSKILSRLEFFLNEAINDINHEGLLTPEEIETPKKDTIARLQETAAGLKNQQLNNKRTSGKINWKEESSSALFTKKRAIELAKLLDAKLIFDDVMKEGMNELQVLRKLLATDKGKVVNIALQANRKRKIGSNLMEIIVCGAVPPYNEILAGKLVSILICSPIVIKDYNDRYSTQISEIASRMKGEEIVRDSRLAFLGTTSLYHMGSSQYNRIKVPIKEKGYLEYKRLGETEGFGSVFFSRETTRQISHTVEMIDGGRKINNVFGEGTSPRLRLIRSGLAALGISSEAFLKHHTRRIVYGIELASNTREFLNGEENYLDYYAPLNDDNAEMYTNQLIEYWRKRWFVNRGENVDIQQRLQRFDRSSILLSNYF